MIPRLLILNLALILLVGCIQPPLPDKSVSDVSFASDDGIKLAGTLYLPPAAADSTTAAEFPAVVLAHMYQNNRQSWDSFARKLAEWGYVTLTFDFRAWGNSGGDKADILHHYLDVLAAVDYLRNLNAVDSTRIAVAGASMGGMAAIEAAVVDSGIAAVAAISTPHSWMGSEPMNVIDKISPRPILIVAALKDPHLTLRAAEQNFLRAKEPKEWVVIDVARHGTDIFATDKAPELKKILLDFLDRRLKNSPHSP